MKVKFLGIIQGKWERLGIGRRDSGDIYFFQDTHILNLRVGDEMDSLVGSTVELWDHFLVIPEKEFDELFKIAIDENRRVK